MFSKCLRPKDNTHRIRYGGQGRCIRRRDRHRGAFCVDLPVHTFEDFMRFEDELQASSAKRMTMVSLMTLLIF